MSKIYIGFDESNNNSIPEFEVFAFTLNPKLTSQIKSQKTYLKKGKERKEKFQNILNEINNEISYQYTIFFEEDIIKLNEFEANQLQKLKKGLTIYSFLKHMKFTDRVDLLIDGFLGNKEQTSEILRFINFYFPNVKIITIGKKADVKIPIINYADRIAYQYFKSFRDFGTDIFKNNNDGLINQTYENRFYLKRDEYCKLLAEFRK